MSKLGCEPLVADVPRELVGDGKHKLGELLCMMRVESDVKGISTNRRGTRRKYYVGRSALRRQARQVGVMQSGEGKGDAR